MALNPFVFWSQTDVAVSLRVDLTGVKNPVLNFYDGSVEFGSVGNGAQGEKQYGFQINLFKKIVPDRCSYKVKERGVEISLRKEEEGILWPTLQEGKIKPQWLKVDFDKWKPDIADEDLDFVGDTEFPSRSKLFDHLEGRERSPVNFRIVYLVLYNLFLFIGYGFIVIVLIISYLREKEFALGRAWIYASNAMKLCQTLQLLEVLHRLIGYTPGSVVEPLLQCGGRYLVLYALLNPEEILQKNYSVYCLFMVWSVVELVRYPYYLFRTCKKEYAILTWLRYTVWIPLYPLGFLTEGLIVLQAIPVLDVSRRFCYDLPNMWNISFDFPFHLRIFLLFAWFPMFYFLFSYMMRQRKHKLSKGKKKIQ